MVAYNFKKEFVPDIEANIKRSTIREIGKKRHARPGEKVQLYTGMRTPQVRLIKEVDCKTSNIVTFDDREILLEKDYFEIVEPDEFARMDGFLNYDHMFRWFVNQYGRTSFRMIRIGW